VENQQRAYENIWLSFVQHLEEVVLWLTSVSDPTDVRYFWQGLCKALSDPSERSASSLKKLKAGFSRHVTIEDWAELVGAICEYGKLEYIEVFIGAILRPEKISTFPISTKATTDAKRRGVDALIMLFTSGGQACKTLKIEVPFEIPLDTLWEILAKSQLPHVEDLQVLILKECPLSHGVGTKSDIHNYMERFFTGCVTTRLKKLKLSFTEGPDEYETIFETGVHRLKTFDVSFYRYMSSTIPTSKDFSFTVRRYSDLAST
jgi:hypothetical protein